MDGTLMRRMPAVSVVTFALVLTIAVLIGGKGTTSGAQAVRGAINSSTFAQTQELSGEELRGALGIPALTWARNGQGGVELSAPSGYEHLEDCGEELAALRVILGDGSAYCIPGAAASPKAGFEAASAVLRITQDRVPGDTELAILRIENELAHVDAESTEHDELLSQLLKLKESLTPSEKATIERAYDRLAVD